jgi:signal transduction histidine kinase
MQVRLKHRLTQLAFRPHLPRRTVRLRLTLLYGGLFLVSGAAVLAITYVLVVHATSGALTVNGPNGASAVSVGSHRAAPRGEHAVQSFKVGAGGFSGLTASGPGSRGLTSKQLEAQGRRFEAQAIQQHASMLHQLLLNSGIALGAMAFASIALGWIVAGRVLRPLRTITTTARDLSATSLHERLALEGPNDELKELGDTFDALLARLEASFRSQRQFVANASHELRTPLARQRTVAQVALADPNATAESLRAAHEQVLASGAQQERLIEALLTLTRGQAGVEARASLDLATLTEQVLLARRVEAELRGLDVHADLSPAPGEGAPWLVERLVANLVDNALRHNVQGGRVEVVTRSSDGAPVLTVFNTGPVVPASAVDRLFQPFQRLGADRAGHTEGLGLGLSIVQAIADAHDASLAVHAEASGGLRIAVCFPKPTTVSGGQIADGGMSADPALEPLPH